MQGRKRIRPTPKTAAQREAGSKAVFWGWLRRNGFTSYRQYLASDLWADIRRRVLERDGGLCVCRRPASQIHHTSYAPSVMSGEDIGPLVSVCRMCHKDSEFDRDGNKKRLTQANHNAAKIADQSGRRHPSGQKGDRLIDSIRAAVEARGVYLRVARGGGRNRHARHWMFEHRDGRRLLDYWPTTGTWRTIGSRGDGLDPDGVLAFLWAIV